MANHEHHPISVETVTFEGFLDEGIFQETSYPGHPLTDLCASSFSEYTWQCHLNCLCPTEMIDLPSSITLVVCSWLVTTLLSHAWCLIESIQLSWCLNCQQPLSSHVGIITTDQECEHCESSYYDSKVLCCLSWLSRHVTSSLALTLCLTHTLDSHHSFWKYLG